MYIGRSTVTQFRYLDEAPVRAAAQADPSLFVRHDGLLVIDEVQRVPDLFLAIKHEVDDRSPDGFVEAVLRHGTDIRVPSSELRRDDYVERAPSPTALATK